MGLLKQELQRALDSGEFIPNFQPLVDLRSGRLEGFEVLARWQHPVLGLLMPSDFVPIVERYSLPIELTSCLLERAFVAMQSLPEHLGLSINAAPEQFRNHSLSQMISSLASKAGFDLRRLTVELTESALIEDLTLAGAVAADLKLLGVRLALDDFGTGYSSLLHLQSLPFDEIKVDRSFVSNMVECPQSRKIVAAVVGLGQSLGLQTVAEGIERTDQSEVLTWLGCNIGQGFLFGRPAAAADLPAIVERSIEGPAHSAPGVKALASALEARPAKRLAAIPAVN